MTAPTPTDPTGPTAPIATTATTADATAPRWTDPAWLDTLRILGDPIGDDCARRLKSEGVTPAQIRRTIEQMKSNDRRLPADAPKPMRDFFDQTYHFCENCGAPELPSWVDRDRIIRGQQAFMERSLPAVLVMLCKSLPEGYAAPSMAKILNMSGDLRAIPFHRLMGTLQLLLNVSAPYSFERMGLGAISGQEMRLLHAGARSNVAPDVLGPEGYEAFVHQYGLPINQEDMAGTIIGFSLLVVEGLATLGLPLDPQVAEDYYYVWRVYAHLMGVRYPGAPDDTDCLPQSIAEAHAFYEAYKRHYVGPTDYSEGWRERAIAANPDGVGLAEAHVRMLGRYVAGQHGGGPGRRSIEIDATGFIGSALEKAGIKAAEKYIHLLTGDAASARIGIEPLAHIGLLGDLLAKVPSWWEGIWHNADPGMHVAASEWLFGKLVRGTYEQGVVFPAPLTVDDLHELAKHGV
ncbi:MAG TPA: oxygenase MpaB family protein [Gemmatimonadaceae bacterium]